MARTNGGITGVSNKTSFGKCKVTTKSSSTPSAVTTQPGTRLVETLVVAVELAAAVHTTLSQE